MRVVVGLATATLMLAACTNAERTASATTTEPEGSTTSTPPTTTETTDVATESVRIVDQTLVYDEDFEGDPPTGWNDARRGTTPIGARRFLGPFGEGPVRLELTDLPAHDVMTVTFDLYLRGSWDGNSNRRWRLTVDDARIINTTFSLNESTQIFPADVPSEPGTGATEVGTLGYAAAEGYAADSVHRIERQFMHGADDLVIDVSGRNVGNDDERSWGIDNMQISVGSLDDRGARGTALEFEVVDQRLAVTGVVPTEEDRERVRELVARAFPDRVVSETIEVGSGAPKPLWLYTLDQLVPLLAPSDNFRLRIDEESAIATGTVRTSYWRNVYESRLADSMSRHIKPVLTVDVSYSEDVVARIEKTRVPFDKGSSIINDDARGVLDELAALLAVEDRVILRVDGHTDSTGESGANRDLSRERADVARAYLVSSGVDSNRLVASARGTRSPEADEVTEADRAANRRVSFFIPRG